MYEDLYGNVAWIEFGFFSILNTEAVFFLRRETSVSLLHHIREKRIHHEIVFNGELK
jgi:hypothetical protein